MSTYLYLECLNHAPALRSEDESGQHLYDLPQIQTDVANRGNWCALSDDDWDYAEPGFHFFRRNTIRFLRAHPLCSIGVRDEYGVVHPIIADGSEPASAVQQPRTGAVSDGQGSDGETGTEQAENAGGLA